MRFEVKAFAEDDIKAALEIERICFPQPLTFEDFLRFIKEGFAFSAKDADKYLGYVVADKILDECHIERIAVHPLFRRQGVGEKLLVSLAEASKEAGGRRMYLEVREGNLASRALYNKIGFVESYTRVGYYSDNNEDAIVMEKKLQGTRE